MNQNCVCWDVETTGLNSREDFIIQLSLIKFKKSDFSTILERSWYIKPAHNFEISEGAQKVHGLTKEFILKNGVYFKDIFDEFSSIIEDSDLLTYNGNTFDIKFLTEECKRWGLELNLDNKKMYDSFAMECRFSPRDLSSVYNKYTGLVLEGAHDALEDVKATKEVFRHQMMQKNLEYKDIDEFQENNLLSPDGSIRNAASPGEPLKIVFAIGKYKDSEFINIAEKDPSYIKWYMENVASNHTKKILSKYYKENKK